MTNRASHSSYVRGLGYGPHLCSHICFVLRLRIRTFPFPFSSHAGQPTLTDTSPLSTAARLYLRFVLLRTRAVHTTFSYLDSAYGHLTLHYYASPSLHPRTDSCQPNVRTCCSRSECRSPRMQRGIRRTVDRNTLGQVDYTPL